jgi:transcription initiation factor TFIID subunit TAF12
MPTSTPGPSRQPAHDAGDWNPLLSKGKAKALVKDTLETERDEREGELNELLKCLDQADVNPTPCRLHGRG